MAKTYFYTENTGEERRTVEDLQQTDAGMTVEYTDGTAKDLMGGKSVNALSRTGYALTAGYTDGTSVTINDAKAVSEIGPNEDNKKLIVQYTDGSLKMLDGLIGDGGGGGSSPGDTIAGTAMNQVTKMDVTAPKQVTVTIEPTGDFSLPDVNVLRLREGGTGTVRTVCGFDNGDAEDFEPNTAVAFDGTMGLRTSATLESIHDNTVSGGYLTVTEVMQDGIAQLTGLR